MSQNITYNHNLYLIYEMSVHDSSATKICWLRRLQHYDSQCHIKVSDIVNAKNSDIVKCFARKKHSVVIQPF